MKFYILIIFQKSYWNFFCLTGKISPCKICLETGYQIEKIVNAWYLTTNMPEASKLWI